MPRIREFILPFAKTNLKNRNFIHALVNLQIR
jgi:hypothetical protein